MVLSKESLPERSPVFMTEISPVELLSVMRTRRSIRKFLADPVADCDITAMIEAASWAPSGTNQQNWHFIVARSAPVKKRLVQAVRQTIETMKEGIVSARARTEFSSYSAYYTFFADAPVVVAVVKQPYESLARRIMKRYHLAQSEISTADIQGASAAVENMLLMAHARGLGACWMTGPLIARPALENVLGIQSPDELMALVPVGKPAVMPSAPVRKNVHEIIQWI